MGVKIPKTNSFVIDDVFNIVLKKRKKKEKEKSKKEPKDGSPKEKKSKDNKNASTLEENKNRIREVFTEVEKIVVQVPEK